MIKGALLGLFVAVFLVSGIFSFMYITDTLQPNIITGNVISPGTFAGYGVLALIVSFVIGLVLLAWVLRSRNAEEGMI